MALTPRIAGTNLVPTGGGRFAANSAVANVEPSPVNELNQISALIYEGDSEFQYDHFDPRQHGQEQQREQLSQQFSGRRGFDRFGRPFEQTPDRRVNNSMLENSSESFAAAFDSTSSALKQLPGEPQRYQPNVALDAIIGTYETTAQVIYDAVPPKGKNLSIVL